MILVNYFVFVFVFDNHFDKFGILKLLVDGDASGSTTAQVRIGNDAQTSNGVKDPLRMCLVDIPMPGTDDSQNDKPTSIPMPGKREGKIIVERKLIF